MRPVCGFRALPQVVMGTPPSPPPQNPPQTGGGTPPPPQDNLSTKQRVLLSIGAVSAVAESIALSFGHNSVAAAVEEFATLTPVFAGLFDAIRGLWHHSQAGA